MAEKLFYSMGEVAEMFDVRQSLIRYWGEQFDALKPKRNKKGNRMFTPEDVETLKLIYHLVKERGMTLDGARRALKAHRRADESVPRDVELFDRLQRLKAMLLQVREQIGGEEGATIIDGDDAADEPAAEPAAEPEKPKSVRGSKAAKSDAESAEPSETVGNTVEDAAEQPAPAKEERPLPFYEQTLF